MMSALGRNWARGGRAPVDRPSGSNLNDIVVAPDRGRKRLGRCNDERTQPLANDEFAVAARRKL